MASASGYAKEKERSKKRDVSNLLEQQHNRRVAHTLCSVSNVLISLCPSHGALSRAFLGGKASLLAALVFGGGHDLWRGRTAGYCLLVLDVEVVSAAAQVAHDGEHSLPVCGGKMEGTSPVLSKK